MKRILLALMLIAVMAVTFSACQTFKENNISYNYDSDSDSYIVSSFTDLKSVTSLTIPDEVNGKPVVSIGKHALSNSNYLTEIVMGENISYIDSWAIRNNILLERIIVSDNNPHFTTVDGVLFNKDMTVLIAYPNNKSDTYTVPEGVVEILDTAFYKCSNLKNVTLASTVTTIGQMSFLKCTSLNSISFGNSLTTIGDNSFLGCAELASITLPSTIENIGGYVFYNCSKITLVDIMRAEEGITFGQKWYPTNNGKNLSGLVINYNEVDNG
jgi:hypothetical protein